jgi:hypothetical protein
MSPLKSKAVGAAGATYGHIFVGPWDHTHAVRLDVSALTLEAGSGGQVDEKGYLRPGSVIQIDAGGTGGAIGDPPTNADQRAGIVPEPLKIVDFDGGETVATAPDLDVAVAINCAVNRAIVEDNLGRALTAAELGALANGGVQVLS